MDIIVKSEFCQYTPLNHLQISVYSFLWCRVSRTGKPIPSFRPFIDSDRKVWRKKGNVKDGGRTCVGKMYIVGLFLLCLCFIVLDSVSQIPHTMFLTNVPRSFVQFLLKILPTLVTPEEIWPNNKYKTGTLTQNLCRPSKLSFSGVLTGHGDLTTTDLNRGTVTSSLKTHVTTTAGQTLSRVDRQIVW